MRKYATGQAAVPREWERERVRASKTVSMSETVCESELFDWRSSYAAYYMQFACTYPNPSNSTRRVFGLCNAWQNVTKLSDGNCLLYIKFWLILFAYIDVYKAILNIINIKKY